MQYLWDLLSKCNDVLTNVVTTGICTDLKGGQN